MCAPWTMRRAGPHRLLLHENRVIHVPHHLLDAQTVRALSNALSHASAACNSLYTPSAPLPRFSPPHLYLAFFGLQRDRIVVHVSSPTPSAPGGSYPHPNTASTNVHCLFIRDAHADGQEPASARAMPHRLNRADQATARARAPRRATRRHIAPPPQDHKFVREYLVNDGDTLNLLVKPREPQSEPQHACPCRMGHQRIPSVVLSPSPSAEAPPGDLPSSSGSSSPSIRSRQNSTTRDITLTLNNAAPVLAVQELSTYHASIANPPVLVGPTRVSGTPPPADAPLAFEEFLRAAKGTLTIARAREPGGRHRHGRVLGAARRMGGFWRDAWEFLGATHGRG
ncbi:hypothetical protein C8J57DRAFT_1710454 [Mycena rebaudengoi]|nr:hypothetical protein C8J57DRAFT_1710454 [Mycena rebaudengoi]